MQIQPSYLEREEAAADYLPGQINKRYFDSLDERHMKHFEQVPTHVHFTFYERRKFEVTSAVEGPTRLVHEPMSKMIGESSKVASPTEFMAGFRAQSQNLQLQLQLRMHLKRRTNDGR